jgi:hypothetical protein
MYSNHVNIAHVREHGGDVLLRYNRGALPLLHEGQPMDVLRHARGLRVTALPAGTTVQFRFRSLTPKGQTDWSQPTSLLVK